MKSKQRILKENSDDDIIRNTSDNITSNHNYSSNASIANRENNNVKDNDKYGEVEKYTKNICDQVSENSYLVSNNK